MKCIECGGPTKCINSRHRVTDRKSGGGSVYRRRQCKARKCGIRFTTYERAREEGPEVLGAVRAVIAADTTLTAMLTTLERRLSLFVGDPDREAERVDDGRRGPMARGA